MLLTNLELAMATPLVGMRLSMTKAITNAPLGEVIRGAAPHVMCSC